MISFKYALFVALSICVYICAAMAVVEDLPIVYGVDSPIVVTNTFTVPPVDIGGSLSSLKQLFKKSYSQRFGHSSWNTDMGVEVPLYLSSFQSDILRKQNKLRVNVGLPPLQWSEQLADFARNQMIKEDEVNGCAGLLSPASKGQQVGSFQNVGENKFQSKSITSAGLVVQEWFNQIECYNYGPTGSSCTFKCSGMSPVNQFTQLMWATTTHVGCDVHRCTNCVGAHCLSFYVTCIYGSTVVPYGGNAIGVVPFDSSVAARLNLISCNFLQFNAPTYPILVKSSMINPIDRQSIQQHQVQQPHIIDHTGYKSIVQSPRFTYQYSQINGYPFSSQLNDHPFTSQINGYPFTSQINGYPFTSQINGYPFTSQINGYPFTSQINGYPFTNQVDNYSISSQLSSDTVCSPFYSQSYQFDDVRGAPIALQNVHVERQPTMQPQLQQQLEQQLLHAVCLTKPLSFNTIQNLQMQLHMFQKKHVQNNVNVLKKLLFHSEAAVQHVSTISQNSQSSDKVKILQQFVQQNVETIQKLLKENIALNEIVDADASDKTQMVCNGFQSNIKTLDNLLQKDVSFTKVLQNLFSSEIAPASADIIMGVIRFNIVGLQHLIINNVQSFLVLRVSSASSVQQALQTAQNQGLSGTPVEQKQILQNLQRLMLSVPLRSQNINLKKFIVLENIVILRSLLQQNRNVLQNLVSGSMNYFASQNEITVLLKQLLKQNLNVVGELLSDNVSSAQSMYQGQQTPDTIVTEHFLQKNVQKLQTILQSNMELYQSINLTSFTSQQQNMQIVKQLLQTNLGFLQKLIQQNMQMMSILLAIQSIPGQAAVLSFVNILLMNSSVDSQPQKDFTSRQVDQNLHSVVDKKMQEGLTQEEAVKQIDQEEFYQQQLQAEEVVQQLSLAIQDGLTLSQDYGAPQSQQQAIQQALEETQKHFISEKLADEDENLQTVQRFPSLPYQKQTVPQLYEENNQNAVRQANKGAAKQQQQLYGTFKENESPSDQSQAAQSEKQLLQTYQKTKKTVSQQQNNYSIHAVILQLTHKILQSLSSINNQLSASQQQAVKEAVEEVVSQQLNTEWLYQSITQQITQKIEQKWSLLQKSQLSQSQQQQIQIAVREAISQQQMQDGALDVQTGFFHERQPSSGTFYELQQQRQPQSQLMQQEYQYPQALQNAIFQEQPQRSAPGTFYEQLQQQQQHQQQQQQLQQFMQQQYQYQQALQNAAFKAQQTQQQQAQQAQQQQAQQAFQQQSQQMQQLQQNKQQQQTESLFHQICRQIKERLPETTKYDAFSHKTVEEAIKKVFSQSEAQNMFWQTVPKGMYSMQNIGDSMSQEAVVQQAIDDVVSDQQSQLQTEQIIQRISQEIVGKLFSQGVTNVSTLQQIQEAARDVLSQKQTQQMIKQILQQQHIISNQSTNLSASNNFPSSSVHTDVSLVIPEATLEM